MKHMQLVSVFPFLKTINSEFLSDVLNGSQKSFVFRRKKENLLYAWLFTKNTSSGSTSTFIVKLPYCVQTYTQKEYAYNYILSSYTGNRS